MDKICKVKTCAMGVAFDDLCINHYNELFINGSLEEEVEVTVKLPYDSHIRIITNRLNPNIGLIESIKAKKKVVKAKKPVSKKKKVTKAKSSTCSEDNCGNKVKAKGMCSKHYQRSRKTK